jgi:hypothetical protein
MSRSSGETILKKNALDKLKYILSQAKIEETSYDVTYKYQLKILFGIDDNSFKLKFDEKSELALMIYKIVDVLYLAMKISKNKRENLYNTYLDNIEDLNLVKLLDELKVLKALKYEISNKKLSELLKIIQGILVIKNIYTLSEYIDSVLLTLSFYLGYECFLKYQIYAMIIQFYLSNFGVILNFHENEINVSEKRALDLICDLFKKEAIDTTVLIESIIILNYNSLEDVLQNKKTEDILLGIQDISFRFNRSKTNIIFYVEEVIEMFADEMDLELYKEKTTKKLDNNEQEAKTKEKIDKSIEEQDKKFLLNEANKNNNSDKVTDKMNVTKAQQKNDIDIVEGDEKVEDNQSYKNNMNIINTINNLIKNINMGNSEDMKKNTESLRNLMLKIVEDNSQLKEKINVMTGKMNEMAQEMQNQAGTIQEMQNQIQEINNLKEQVNNLRDECDDLNVTLNKIKFRDLSRNFLRCFYPYLEKDDWKIINNNRNLKGEIISNKIKKKYPKCDEKKMNLIQNLIKKSSNLLNQGNRFAHHILIKKFQYEIEEYKERNNLDRLSSPNLFCLLLNLGISYDADETFEDSYSFLKNYFTRNLRKPLSDNLLDSYFN